MKSEELFSAIGEIEDEYILESYSVRKKTPLFNHKKFVAIAACLIIAIAITIGAVNLRFNTSMGGASEAPNAPDLDKEENFTEDSINGGIGGIELYERIENECGYFWLERFDDNNVILKLKLNKANCFGILYLEEYGDKKLYTCYGSLDGAAGIKPPGYDQANENILVLVDGMENEIPIGKEIQLSIALPTLIDANAQGVIKIYLGDRVVVI